MDERERVAAAAERMAAAILRRDGDTVRTMLAPGFVHRTHGGERLDAEAFLRAISEVPGEILLVRLEQVQVDLAGGGALVTGRQHAQVRVNQHVVDDRRRFVDWFVQHEGTWRVQASVDLALTDE